MHEAGAVVYPPRFGRAWQSLHPLGPLLRISTKSPYL